MYKFAQLTMKLDGVITEFCDIFSPISQMLKTNSTSNESSKTIKVQVKKLIRAE